MLELYLFWGKGTSTREKGKGKREKRRESSQIIINREGNMAKKILISSGDILKEEYLDPMGISAYRLAREIGVSTSLISQIIHGTTAISTDVAWRLGQFFDTSAQYWLNIQASCDSRKVEDKYAHKNLKISSYRQFTNILTTSGHK